MGKVFGSQSMVAPLQSVLVRRPDAAFANADPERWHYTARPDLDTAVAEHDALVRLLHEAGAEVIYHDVPLPDHADAIYVHDPVIVSDRGAIILQMGKGLRLGEEAAMATTLRALGIPILATLDGNACAEGGDLLWIDRRTLAAGQGFRTNAAGIQQLQAALGPEVKVVAVPLPYGQGPEACLHLMSFISMVADDLAVAYLPLMPVPFYQELRARGIRLVEVPDEEFVTMGPNVLALAPYHCLMLDGNPITKMRLEAAGCRVWTYKGDEISLKAEGGATCLTRPICRAS
jgi:dimethylargininase